MEYTTRTRVPWFFFQKDEGCFFTYAQYVEPLASTAVTINDLQQAIVLRILHTWGLRFRSSMLKLYITDRQDREHLLQGEDSLYQILGAYHPLWFVDTFHAALNALESHLFAHMSFASLVELNWMLLRPSSGRKKSFAAFVSALLSVSFGYARSIFILRRSS